MSAYDPDVASKPVLTQGRPITVWENEDPLGLSGNGASQQVSIHRDLNFPVVLAVETKFSGAPGAFSLDLQTSDTDEDAMYVTKASMTAVNASFVGRLEVTNVVAKFARLKMGSRGNSVSTVFARIS